LIHYGQIIRSKKFQRFNFGAEENKKRYGQELPPEYDLSKIRVPTALLTGDIDTLGDQKDVKWLKEESGLNYMFAKEYHFAHGTFNIAKDASYVHEDLIPLIEKARAGPLFLQ
jgi:hypothetical protein